MERNIERMQRRMNDLGVKFRPHVKTSKCVEVTRTQVADSAQAARAIGEFGRRHGEVFEVWIETDTDGHRSGIKPDHRRRREAGRCAVGRRRPALARGGAHGPAAFRREGGSGSRRRVALILGLDELAALVRL